MKGIIRKLFGQSGASSMDKEGWQQKIGPISQKAFELAIARWERNAPLDEQSLAEARRLQEELRAIATQLREDYPEIYRSFSSTISEALLDFKYAISAPPATSLRLGHYIEGKQGQGGSDKQT